MQELKENGALNFTVNDSEVSLAEEDLLIDMVEQEGFQTEQDGQETVVLDLRLSDELVDEGFVRELISKIQTMRKEADFNVTDHIRISYKAEGTLDRIFKAYGDAISKETLGESITSEALTGYEKNWDVNGETCTIAVERI